MTDDEERDVVTESAMEPEGTEKPEPRRKGQFDLAERTARFGEETIRLAKRIRVNEVTRPLISQFVRAGTSIQANYCEADEADSKKEFRYKIGLCKKECRETRGWLRQIVAAQEDLQPQTDLVSQEAKELNLIFAAIIRKCDGRGS